MTRHTGPLQGVSRPGEAVSELATLPQIARRLGVAASIARGRRRYPDVHAPAQNGGRPPPGPRRQRRRLAHAARPLAATAYDATYLIGQFAPTRGQGTGGDTGYGRKGSSASAEMDWLVAAVDDVLGDSTQITAVSGGLGWACWSRWRSPRGRVLTLQEVLPSSRERLIALGYASSALPRELPARPDGSRRPPA